MPRLLASNRAWRVFSSPIASTTYGGESGREFTLMAWLLLRIALSTVNRLPLMAMASAPAPHSPSTRSARSSSRTRSSGRPLGESATVTRMPGPRAAV